MGGIIPGERSSIAGTSATLLGALERLHSVAIDIVLLSHKFRDEELALFTADARRSGFAGLILRVAPMGAYQPDFSAKLPIAGFSSATRPFSNTPPGTRAAPGVISLTDKQRAVLAYVSEGWTNQRIAQELKCTEAAVKAVVQALFRKLHVRKRAQIVRLAIQKRLIPIAPKSVRRADEMPQTNQADALPPISKDQQPIHVGDFIIDVEMHQVWVCGVEIRLTPSEFQLLWILARHSGKLVKSGALREMFWRNPASREASLRVLVGALRAKIETTKIPRYVVTERSLGYRFIPSPSASGPIGDYREHTT
jgi:DNA-binding CsgD family transcriptional regulator/DNA-binding winged helix-turn-helix (wHTH) protein